ncbi:hypothetical protein VPNG_01364 [Cytospora leucostoma]|uniref:Uncharacterized protein n=1 Tax=Cytospora leucostoma TaxID=1230097 RepID=A0A423XL49_9PEZI|nr:hypothetical protein VPNG_01364 [Cytospora leucostoma]
MNAIRVSALQSGSRAAQPTCLRAISRRGYATDHYKMDTPNKPSRLPILFGVGALLLGGSLYLISGSQKDVKHNDHAAQQSYTQGRNQGRAKGGVDQSKSDLPADAPNHPDNLAASQQKMQDKPTTKKTDPLK